LKGISCATFINGVGIIVFEETCFYKVRLSLNEWLDITIYPLFSAPLVLKVLAQVDAIIPSSNFSLFIFRIGLALEVDIASLVEFLEEVMFLLNSALSFFKSSQLKELPQQLAIITSISCALVANS